jgi:hypothetical protein
VQLHVDGLGVGERELALVAVVIVLRLLRHGERAGNGDLDPALGEATEELDVAKLHGPCPANRADDSRDRVLVARAVERDSRPIEVDAVERGGEPVRVALPPHLAVGDDVDAGPLHVLHRDAGCVVLCLFEVRLGDAPQLRGPDARRQALSQPLAVDEPARLRIAADHRRRESSSHRDATYRRHN